MGILFREFILSGGDRIVGDIADGQLIQSIHAHWYRVFSGREPWRGLRIFFPADNTLGYSDTFFLQGIPYTIFRFLGTERFIAYKLVQMLLVSIWIGNFSLWILSKVMPSSMGLG